MVLALLCVLYLLLYIDRVNIATVAPLIRADLELSNTQMGLIFSAFSIPYAFFQLFGGWARRPVRRAADTLDLLCSGSGFRRF